MQPSTPSFPDGLLEMKLDRLPLSGLETHDEDIEERLFQICQSYGFFYVDLTETERGKRLLADANRMLRLAEIAFAIPLEEKEKISQQRTGSMTGWKAPGAISDVDQHGRQDYCQFFNVSKDDVFAHKGAENVAYPSPIKEELSELFPCFMRTCHDIGLLVLHALARRLSIPAEEIDKRHIFSNLCGEHARLSYAPKDESAPERLEESDLRITTFSHTDVGSITLLFNWLGGLQIENPQTRAWNWVRPEPGHVICNLGDAMYEFSGGRLNSGKHRVVTAPGLQAQLERYSVVYFVRPTNNVYLENLTTSRSQNSIFLRQEHRFSSLKQQWTMAEWTTAKMRNLGNLQFSKE